MFEHVRNLFPWYERAKRKTEFVRKLQDPMLGKPKVRFKSISTILVGTDLIISNNSTGDVLSAVYIDTNNWLTYGTSFKPKNITNIELEDLLTEMRGNVSKDDDLIFYDSGLLILEDHGN